MTATIIKFPNADERKMRRIFAALPKPTPAVAYARALARQRGEPMGMFSGAAK